MPAVEALADLDAFGRGFILAALRPGRRGSCGTGGRRQVRSCPARHRRVRTGRTPARHVEADHVGGVVADLARRARNRPGRQAPFRHGPRSLVSGRRGPAESPEATRTAVEGGDTVASPTVLLETLVGHVVSAMATTGQRLSDALDGIEDHILDGRPRDDRRRLGPVRRNAVRLHRQIAGLAAVFTGWRRTGRRTTSTGQRSRRRRGSRSASTPSTAT